MKTLSAKQPWAWALFHGKPVENRSWATTYRGPLLIHASKTFDHAGYRWILDNRKKLYLTVPDIPSPDQFVFGAVIGKVNMVDCVSSHVSSWYFPGCWGHVYKDQQLFKKPIPYKGVQKYFNVPDELIIKFKEK